MTAEREPEVLAIRYGTVQTTRSAVFHDYGQYGEPDAAAQMDYFFWLIRGQDCGTVLVDTGFDPRVGRRRGRTCLVDPVAALAGLGVAAAEVQHVVITHLHYDHVGNLAAFPAATVTVAAAELEFWSGSGPAETGCLGLVEPAEIEGLKDAVRQGRVRAIEREPSALPGLEIRLVGGHTPGQLVVSVPTAGGRVVLASDAVHFAEEMRRDRPHQLVVDMGAMRAAYAWLREEEQAGALVIAGHDPAVTSRFETAATLGGGSALRLAS
jgi:glyoxylase-like metal-dependent hydrolase (beta-lactamase superfamily II)